MNAKWDQRFMAVAQLVATWSKDPSTKVGAHIVQTDRTPVSYGYNGFPRNVHDTDDRYANRELKYKLVVHAERNAILNAHGQDLRGTIIYVTAFPCTVCAQEIIQAGISMVIAPEPTGEFLTRWMEDIHLAKQMFKEAEVHYRPPLE